MAVIVSVINMKGGVGKTTLTTNLSFILAKGFGKKILLVDIDPQSNASQTFLSPKEYVDYLNDENKLTVFDVFAERMMKSPSTVRKSGQKRNIPTPTLENLKIDVYKNGGLLDLIPSTLELFDIDASKRGTERRLGVFLDKIKDKYDFIFIDCPPTISIFTLSAYITSDAYLVALKPDHLSSIGLPLLERTIQQYEMDFGKKIKRIGIVFTMVDRRVNLMKEVREQIRTSRSDVFDSIMRQSIKIAEAARKNKVICTYREAHSHEQDINNIAREFIERVEQI